MTNMNKINYMLNIDNLFRLKKISQKKLKKIIV